MDGSQTMGGGSQTLVFFHAHPDDEAIATAGTMLKASLAGHRVVLVVATNGELGLVTGEVLEKGGELGRLRRQEVHRAAEILGIHRVEFLDYHDSGMAGDPTNQDPKCFWQADVDQAAAQLGEILGQENPAVLTVYDPNGGYGHPDHIQVHRVGTAAAAEAGVTKVYWATMNRDQIRRQMAAQDAAEALLDEERRERASEEDFGMPESEITHAIDVSDVLDTKRQAMEAHASQITPESFFLAMDEDNFKVAFGTEWYVAAHLEAGARPGAGGAGAGPDATAPDATAPDRFFDDLLLP